MQVFLRRTSSVPVTVLPDIQTHGITLIPSSRILKIDGKLPQNLTLLEFRLLYMLMTNENQVIPTEVIVDRVWGYDGAANKELVRGLVRRLRVKVEPNPKQPKFIHNIPGVGYQFTNND